MVMLSPVCTPIGSRFSMLHTTSKLSAQSRITSSSNSFQFSADSSSHALWTGEAFSAFSTASVSREGVLTQLAPVPPSANDERTISG